jgi:predicted deacetylase
MQSPETPSKPSRALVVSLHDVSTVTVEECGKILSDLDEIGIKTTSLLVIPDHHRRGKLLPGDATTPWLHQKNDQGHEIVLHGYYHQRLSTKSANPVHELVATRYTAGEGEFYDIDYPTATDLLRKGLQCFHECGFYPKGFIAPAWLLGNEAARAVAEAGFEYTTRIGKVIDLTTGWEISSRSLVYSVRSGWRRSMSLIWNFCLNQCLARTPLLRVGLHPPDWRYPAIRKQILQLLSRALADRQPMTYETWLKANRPKQP